jgi:hypothetical protein
VVIFAIVVAVFVWNRRMPGHFMDSPVGTSIRRANRRGAGLRAPGGMNFMGPGLTQRTRPVKGFGHKLD